MIIILALVAAFLGLRLYSVLGKHGDDGVLPRPEEKTRTAPSPAAPSVAMPDLDTPIQPSRGLPIVYAPNADLGLRAIMAGDRNFDVTRFLAGAQAAYRLILEAFWRGDKDALRDLCCDARYAQNAAQMGEMLRQEDGVGCAADLIERLIREW